MKSTAVLVGLTALFLLVAIAKGHHSYDYQPPCSCEASSNVPSIISSAAEIVTYGEPCFCKESIPYSIQVPKKVPTHPVEPLKRYGFSVEMPPSESPCRSFQLPVKIQKPIIQEATYEHDTLSGRSYSVGVEHQAYFPNPRRYSFDCAIQKPVKPRKVVHKPSMSISIQQGEEHSSPRFAPLPIAVQTPVQKVSLNPPRLTGLSAKVDRVLVPACEINDCPDCRDVIPRNSNPKLPFTPCK